MAKPMQIIGFAGWSGSGKTTLIAKIIPLMIAKGLRVSTIKHAHHNFDVDQPGKDSWLHRQTGATEVLVASDRRFALMHELRDAREPSLDELVTKLTAVDLVFIEGFKGEPYPKIEVYRPELGKPPLCREEAWVKAVASPLPVEDLPAPWLPLDQPQAIADFILGLGALR